MTLDRHEFDQLEQAYTTIQAVADRYISKVPDRSEEHKKWASLQYAAAIVETAIEGATVKEDEDLL